jgi:ketosteroid isomerase-like protein
MNNSSPTQRSTGPATIVMELSIALAIGVTAMWSAPALANTGDAPKDGPTAGTALAAEQEIARAMRDNDAAAIQRMLADDWVVISTTGGVGEGKATFPDGIKSGYLTRKTFDLSEPRVRVYGNMAVITAIVKTSGQFSGKPFDVTERQTDVLRWEHGGWKSVLTHETKITQ